MQEDPKPEPSENSGERSETQANIPAGKKSRIKLKEIRADVSAPLGATKREYHLIPVRKPGNQKCIRTYPKEFWFVGAALAEREGDTERKPYLFSAEMAAMVPAQVKTVTLAPYVDKQLNLCLWPLKHNSIDRPNDYNSTALHCAHMALEEWGHIVNAGSHYAWIPGIGNWPDPEWPDLTLEEIIDKAFPGDRYIESVTHDFMQELLGA
jgi:hypothetical protein